MINLVEIFKPIYIDNKITKYLISDFGTVKNSETNKEIQPTTNNKGYIMVNLYLEGNGSYKTFLVHRLVAKAFVPNPNDLPIVNHKIGWVISHDNCFLNLEWVSYSVNNKHAFDTGLKKATPGRKGTLCNLSKYTEDDVINVCDCIQDGLKNKDIVKKLSVSKDFISKIKQGRTWKHISKNYSFMNHMKKEQGSTTRA